MQLFTRRSWQGVALYAALLLGISGCRSAGDAVSKDRELEELRYDNARKREAIIAGLGDAERTRRALSELEAERTGLVKQVSDLGTSLRAATTELASVTTERDGLRGKVTDLEKTSERAQQSLEKVRSVASASAGELADLRLRNQDLDENVRQLRERQGTLAEENKKFTREVEDLREELVRTRAVLRSIRDGAPDKAGIAALEEQVQFLQRQNADLEGEKVALQKRIDSLASTSADGSPTPAGDGAASTRSASSLLWEVGGLVKERYEGALQGQFHWDSFDLILLGAIAVVLLFLYWVAIRWLRTRRLKKQVRTLTARVVELEQGGSGSRGSGEVAADAGSGSFRGESASRARKLPTIRRSGFAAVITNKDAPAKAAGPRPAETAQREPRRIERATPIVPDQEKVLEGVLHGGGAQPIARASDRGREKHEPRKQIGARTWGNEAEAPHQDELANTQIINKVTVDDHAPEPLPPLSAKPAGMADPLRGAGPGRPKKDSGGEDLELLQELKAVINKKFDDLMK